MIKNAKWFIIESISYVSPKGFKEWIFFLSQLPLKTVGFCIQMRKDGAIA